MLRPDFLPITVMLTSRDRARRSLRASFRVGLLLNFVSVHGIVQKKCANRVEIDVAIGENPFVICSEGPKPNSSAVNGSISASRPSPEAKESVRRIEVIRSEIQLETESALNLPFS